MKKDELREINNRYTKRLREATTHEERRKVMTEWRKALFEFGPTAGRKTEEK